MKGHFSRPYKLGLLNCTILARMLNYTISRRYSFSTKALVINSISEFDLGLEQLIKARCVSRFYYAKMFSPLSVSKFNALKEK